MTVIECAGNSYRNVGPDVLNADSVIPTVTGGAGVTDRYVEPSSLCDR